MQEERVLHEAKLAKMEAEMKMVFQQKVQEKEAKLKQSEEELYARHREMKDALDKQRQDLEDKKRRIESGRPLTPEKATVSIDHIFFSEGKVMLTPSTAKDEEGFPSRVRVDGFDVRTIKLLHSPPLCSLSPYLHYVVLLSALSFRFCSTYRTFPTVFVSASRYRLSSLLRLNTHTLL